MSVNLDPRPGDPFPVTTHLLQKITELERENAALRKDKKRLDWLDNYGYEYEGLLERGWGIALPLGQKNNTRDIRKAIDMNLWPITIDAA